MRITVGSYIIDSTPASSTTTSAALRLPFDQPFVPVVNGNTLRISGFSVFVSQTTEGALKTDVDAVIAQFDTASGKDITFYNTTGTALHAVSSTDWPETGIEYEVDYSDNTAEIVFDVVGARPEPVTGGSADEEGQRGEIEWQLEIGGGGLTGARAIAEFGPSSSNAAWENAATWVAKMFDGPPTGMPAFFSDRLRAVNAVPVSRQKPNQDTITDESYDPVTVMVILREVYAGLGTIPSDATDVNVNISIANADALDSRSGETGGSALVVLAGYFFVKTEAPTDFLSGETAIGRNFIYIRAENIATSIENDFRSIYSIFDLHELGDMEINIAPDTGRCTFSRTYSTTRVLRWSETTRVHNVDPVVVNRDHLGRDHVHHGRGGPVATLNHTLTIEALDVIPYRPPPLDDDWVRLDADLDTAMQSVLRGGTIVHKTRGSSNWRYANPTERGPSDRDSFGSSTIDDDDIGDGTIG